MMNTSGSRDLPSRLTQIKQREDIIGFSLRDGFHDSGDRFYRLFGHCFDHIELQN